MEEQPSGGGPKLGFWFVVVLVIGGLVVYAFRNQIFPPAGGPPGPTTTAAQQTGSGTEAGKPPAQAGPVTETPGPEAQDAAGITTVKEYTYKPAEKLPEVKGVSNYKPLADNTVRFALNVWAGWAPIFYANGGMKAAKVWKGPNNEEFRVELVLIDEPVSMRDAYAAGDVHIGWATLDMVPLFMESLRKDSRVMPRVYQQIDWSNGGDGIVVREAQARNINELRGKTMVLAQNSPSHYFALNALINSGVQPSEVEWKFTTNAFEAAAAFNGDKSIAACVSWAPDIYNLSKVKGNKLLLTTQTANKLIADVWFARADFAKDHPGVIEGLVRGIFDAMEDLKGQDARQKVAKLMAEGYSIPEGDALAMLGDAHWTNYAENREFFLNQNNPANFQRTWDTAYYLYKRIGTVSFRTAFDEVMDFSLIQKLGKEAKYAHSKNEYDVTFVPRTVTEIQAESGEILTKSIQIHFFPNSFDLMKKMKRDVGGKMVEELYDPNVNSVLEEVGRLAGQYGAARIVIEGHTDSSMKDKVPDRAVKELSESRSNAVKAALVQKFNTLQPNQFAAVGHGWEVPADPDDPLNHAKNRRVEIKVFPLESTGGE